MAFISSGTTIIDNGAFQASLGSLVHIKTLTASSSATLSFVHGTDGVVLDSSYPIYRFEYINCHPATDNVAFQFNMSVDGGSNYNVVKTSNYFYSYQDEVGSATGLVYFASGGLAQSTNFQPLSFSLGSGNDESLSGELNLFNPSSTTFVKHFTAVNNVYHKSDFTQNRYVAGYGNNTSAVNAIRFQMSSGNIEAGDICLYGIA